MDKIKDNPSSVLIGIGVILCCIFTSVLVVRSIRNSGDAIPPTPLSEVVLKPDDLTSGLFSWTGRTSDCNAYLSLQSLQESLGNKAISCYQVKYATSDNSTIILNAIWRFGSVADANLELDKLTELIPTASNIKMSMVTMPINIGERSSASTATITGAGLPIYVTNLFWRYDSTIVRLSIISNQSVVPIDSMLTPAQKINERLK